MIETILARAKKLNANIDSIVVEEKGTIKEGVVNNIPLHELRSCTKMLTAFACGIALNSSLKCKYTDEIFSLDTKVYPTFTAIYKGNIPEQVKEWSIKTLLTHSTGYDKMLLNAKQVKALDQNNLLEAVFNTKLKYKANKHFTYSNVEPYLFSVFFQENFGIKLSDYINEKIFKPLGIKEYKWNDLGKYSHGASGLYMSYKDFHKIGKLLMDQGRYKNKQIVPQDWVKQMSTKHINTPFLHRFRLVLPKYGAGYHIWISKKGVVYRDGSGGQYIICDHNHDRLITIMSTQKDMSLVKKCLKGFV